MIELNTAAKIVETRDILNKKNATIMHLSLRMRMWPLAMSVMDRPKRFAVLIPIEKIIDDLR